MEMEDPEEIIEGVLFEGATGLLYGERNVGKTFLSLDMALRVALGWEWFGRATRQGVVFYIYAEAPPHLKKRVLAFAEANGITLKDLEGKVYFYPSAINLMSTTEVHPAAQEFRR
jgi:RecA-family ATPase